MQKFEYAARPPAPRVRLHRDHRPLLLPLPLLPPLLASARGRLDGRIALQGDAAGLRLEGGNLSLRAGETAELKDLVDYSRRFRIGLVAMTADAASTLGKSADVALVVPQAREACPHNLAPTTSSSMQLALGDALAIALLESRGFTAVDFGLLHPGGRLGLRVTCFLDGRAGPPGRLVRPG